MTFKNFGCIHARRWAVFVIRKPVSWPSGKSMQNINNDRNTSARELTVCLITTSTLSTTWLSLLRAFSYFSISCFTFNSLWVVSFIVNKHCYTTAGNGSPALAQRDRFSLSFGVRRQSCVFTVPSARWHLIFRFKWHFSMFTRRLQHSIWIIYECKLMQNGDSIKWLIKLK